MIGFGTNTDALDCDAKARCTLVLRQREVALLNLARKIRDVVHILVSLGGQAQHEVQLDRRPASFKCFPDGAQKVFFGDALVDNIAQALGTGLRRKRQRGFAHFLGFASASLRTESILRDGSDTLTRRSWNLSVISRARSVILE